jgi:poly(3-hydroxybutyrate) depolymerase
MSIRDTISDSPSFSGADSPPAIGSAAADTPQFNADHNRATRSTPDTTFGILPAPMDWFETKPPYQPGTTNDEHIDVDGTKRDYTVHVPAGWHGEKPLKVMYFLNGVSPGKPEDTFTGLSGQADKNGYLLVDLIGDGPAHTFNNGQSLMGDGHNESNYLNAVHKRLQSQFNLDDSHQGIVGFSEGGSEAIALAAQNKWLSSVQSVEGFMTGKEQLNGPISAQFFNGVHDPVVPINGTKSLDGKAALTAGLGLVSPLLGLGSLLSGAIDGASDGAQATPGGTGAKILGGIAGFFGRVADQTVAPVLENTGNYIEPQRYAVQSFNQADGTGAPVVTESNGDRTEVYTNTTSGAQVSAVQLGSGTHGWPGSKVTKDNIPGIGEPDPNTDASVLISNFFENHGLLPKPLSPPNPLPNPLLPAIPAH